MQNMLEKWLLLLFFLLLMLLLATGLGLFQVVLMDVQVSCAPSQLWAVSLNSWGPSGLLVWAWEGLTQTRPTLYPFGSLSQRLLPPCCIISELNPVVVFASYNNKKAFLLTVRGPL